MRVTRLGFEPDYGKSTNPSVLAHSRTEAVQNPVQSDMVTSLDPDLIALIQAWPTLPPAIRQAISSIVSVHGTATLQAVGKRSTALPERDPDELPPGYERCS